MANDETLRSLMFTLSYVLMKRRRDVTSADAQRRREVQRRVAHRQYFHQRHKRMIMVRIVKRPRCALNLAVAVSASEWSQSRAQNIKVRCQMICVPFTSDTCMLQIF